MVLQAQTSNVERLQSRVDGHLLLDPTIDEAYREDGSALVAMMPSANAVSLIKSPLVIVLEASPGNTLDLLFAG